MRNAESLLRIGLVSSLEEGKCVASLVTQASRARCTSRNEHEVEYRVNESLVFLREHRHLLENFTRMREVLSSADAMINECAKVKQVLQTDETKFESSLAPEKLEFLSIACPRCGKKKVTMVSKKRSVSCDESDRDYYTCHECGLQYT